MGRRLLILCFGAVLVAVLTVLAYVGVDAIYPSPNCSLENCNLPIILAIVVPGTAAVLALILVRVAGIAVNRLVLWILGLSAAVTAVIFEFPRHLQQPSAHADEAAIGAAILFFIYVPAGTALLLVTANAVFHRASATSSAPPE